MQTIDPIKPFKKRPDIGLPPNPRAAHSGSIDGMVGHRQPSTAGPGKTALRAQQTAVPPSPRVTSMPSTRTSGASQTGSSIVLAEVEQKKSKKSKQKRIAPMWAKGLLFGIAVLFLAALGIFPEVGQVVILVGAAVAIVRKVESRMIFALALATLVLIPIGQVLNASYLANSYAIFAYLLLFGGTVGLAVEILGKRKLKLSTVMHKKA